MLYVRFKVSLNNGFETEVSNFSFSPLTGFIYLWKGVFDTPHAVKCNQFIEFEIIDKNECGLKYTFFREFQAAFNIFNITLEDD